MPDGRIVHEGMGGFLNPPNHPEHNWSIQTDLRRRPENRGGMSLSAAATASYVDAAPRAAARRKLAEWQKLPLESPEVQAWVLQVLGYFRNCYSGIDSRGAQSWFASDVRILPDADPMLNVDIHAGVHHIREYYPEFVPTAEHFAQAAWGSKTA